MENIAEILEGVKTMGIGGHIRPDGDCVGSCMGLYLYLKENYPDIAAGKLRTKGRFYLLVCISGDDFRLGAYKSARQCR